MSTAVTEEAEIRDHIKVLETLLIEVRLMREKLLQLPADGWQARQLQINEHGITSAQAALNLAQWRLRRARAGLTSEYYRAA